LGIESEVSDIAHFTGKPTTTQQVH